MALMMAMALAIEKAKAMGVGVVPGAAVQFKIDTPSSKFSRDQAASLQRKSKHRSCAPFFGTELARRQAVGGGGPHEHHADGGRAPGRWLMTRR